jgi:chemotaxis protein MotB
LYKKNPKDKEKIDTLAGEVKKLKDLRAKEKREFKGIERELRKQLKDTNVKLDMEKRGLVIILADNILFDSGKARIKREAYGVLNKIASVIKEKAPDKSIGVEGHTDNVPITHSSWKSNRELSTARANNVYHYLVKKGNLKPSMLTTMGYGEFRPVATNATSKGRAKNRRVEIVILPQYLKKPAEKLGEPEGKKWAK